MKSRIDKGIKTMGKGKEGVFVILLNDEDKILFYEEQKSFGFGKLRLPGGDIELFDSDIFQTAKREMKEEFDVEIEILKDIGYLICEYNNVLYKNYLVVARIIGNKLKPNLKENVANPIWLTIEDYEIISIDKTFVDMKRVIDKYKETDFL